MKERVITFGAAKNLVGILTEPEENRSAQDAACVLVLNAGILHHVGPFRMSVDLARQLAANGNLVFRFDVAGIGDSPIVNGAGYDEDRIIEDVRAAIDELECRKGVDQFILIGLCTGAANAHKVARVDDRVKGAAFLGGYSYPTWRFYMKHYLTAMMDPVRVKNLPLRLLQKLVGGFSKNDGSTEVPEAFGWWQLPPKEEVQADLEKLVDRDVNLLYVYTGEERDVYNYEDQLKNAFPGIDFRGKVKVIINNEADHTYIMAEDRDRLICQLSDWINGCDTK